MKEDLLHFIWRCDKLQGRPLTTSTSDNILIVHPGTLNRYAGPDFFNAKIEVGGQLWAGNVEMHLKSSDWYAHHHETDENYTNVILHVVWEDDVAVFGKDGKLIPTLELKTHIQPTLLGKYQELFQHYNPSFINCERDFLGFDSFLLDNFMERLYLERLEQKSELINNLLHSTNNDWEAVFFALLAKSFGTKVNGEFFLQCSGQLKFSIVRKVSADIHVLESLLFGHFGILDVEDCSDSYFQELSNEYNYLSKKYDLPIRIGKPNFFGLRPRNFPTIRISQLACLLATHQNLFSALMENRGRDTVYRLFDIAASTYWDTHFTFGRASRKSKKKLSRSFIDLLMINTIVPLKFCYAKHLGLDWSEDLLDMVSGIKAEKNSIVKNFAHLGSASKNALESQAKIQLHTQYCSKNKCLRCTLGADLLNRNT
ncbi:DUF2851 family protein [Flagellimonas flava]|uniref:DUF2851 domain-containing protein n=1 Tax=Flagellimonas flava TaxID=570519 RepID=A0A1M5PH61_9FLAO|nr:DUF2851 family protein [Allomuricauda flava]SHH00583.1 Protein of unknown function [Allomuricauda flava]